MSELETDVQELLEETRSQSAEELVQTVLARFGERVALASSLGVEDQVLTDMMCQTVAQPKIFTLDTGRLPQETFEVIEGTRKKYGIEIEIIFPERDQVEHMVRTQGPNLFYEGVAQRKECCRIRKIEPLRRRLDALDAWICGLRSEQSTTRTELDRVEADETFGLVKISPLADWSTDDVWEYVKARDIPYNVLHDRGYPSIGCAPCTRAVEPGQDLRAGRWWWEIPEQKECGLHLRPDGKLGRREDIL